MIKMNRGGKQDSMQFRELTSKQVDKNCKYCNIQYVFHFYFAKLLVI